MAGVMSWHWLQAVAGLRSASLKSAYVTRARLLPCCAGQMSCCMELIRTTSKLHTPISSTNGARNRSLVVAQVRLMLVLAPAACCLAGIAAHEALLTLTRSIRGRLAARAQSPMEGCVNLDSSGDKGPGREAAGPARPELSKRASRKAGDGGKVGPAMAGWG